MSAAFWHHRSRTSPIGLDIGSQALRLAQLTCARGRYTVRVATRSESSANASDPKAVSTRIRNCVRQSEAKGRGAVVALASPQINYFALELPPSSPAEREGIARFEVQRLVADRAEEVEIRHWNVPAGRPQAPSALGLAVPRTAVQGLVQVAEDACLSCIRVDSAEAALSRFASLLIPDRQGGVWGVLDCGRRHVRLLLCVDDVPVLIRVVGPGGDALTERLATSLQVSIPTAETEKCTHGIAEPAKSTAGEPEVEIGVMHFSILRADLQALAAEIKRSYEYVLSCYPGRKARDLVLVGGGAQMLNLESFLGAALGITVHRASHYLQAPESKLFFASSKGVSLESMAQAIALAIAD